MTLPAPPPETRNRPGDTIPPVTNWSEDEARKRLTEAAHALVACGLSPREIGLSARVAAMDATPPAAREPEPLVDVADAMLEADRKSL